MNNNNKLQNNNKITIIKTITFDGWNIIYTQIEISITSGLPIILIVGLPNKTVNESKERIRCVLSNMGINLPIGRIVINLSPGNVLKEGTHYDLGILCGLLIHMNHIKIDNLEEYIFFGELQLNGDIVYTHGSLPVGIYTYKNNYKLISSCEAKYELSVLYEHINNILLFSSIKNLIDYFNTFNVLNITPIPHYSPDILYLDDDENFNIIISDVCKRLITITGGGEYNLLLFGPPGSGKTTLAKLIKNVLPPLTYEESLEVSSIYSMCGILNNKLIDRPPFRMPHASSSIYSLLGGGNKPKPGEVSLSHKGILFLDELNNFSSNVLDGLRECLNDDIVRVSRVNYQITYPGQIQLIGAMNPCKCGFLGSKNRICVCSNRTIENYRQRISGPFLDRINLKFFLEDNNYSSIKCEKDWFIQTRKTIERVRNFYKTIYGKKTSFTKVSNIPFYIIEKELKIKSDCKLFIEEFLNKKKPSLREYHNILKIAYTITIIDKKNEIELEDFSEALFFSNYNL